MLIGVHYGISLQKWIFRCDFHHCQSQ